MPSWTSSLPFVFALAGAGLIALAGTVNGGEDQVVLRNLDSPGSFEVEITGPDISLRRRIEVQKLRDGGWSAVASDVRLDKGCAEDLQSDCRLLAAGAKMRPMPWDGYTCNSKCGEGCKGNAYLGPGEFRMVIFTCDGKRKFIGPSFRMGKI